MTSILSDIEDEVSALAGDLRAKADHLEQSVRPVIHDGAQMIDRVTQSPILAELMGLADGVLPPATEAAIVAIIRDAGDAAAKVAALTAPPAEPEAPSEPEQPANPEA